MTAKPREGLENLLKLFSLERKKDVEKYCRDLVIKSEDLADIILAGRISGLRPYLYNVHFSETVPEYLNPTEQDFAALTSNGVGKMSRGARKTANKISEIFNQRRLFSAHLFYAPSHKFWNLFYFDQRDVDSMSNHWVSGPHIHYSRESFCREPLQEVWRNVCNSPPVPPSGIHIRYDYHHHRKQNRG